MATGQGAGSDVVPMSRADGILRVVLTGKWFDMIVSGEKLEEYRGRNWAKKLLVDPSVHPSSIRALNWPFYTLVASRGYTKQTLTRKIKHIRWGLPRPEWSGDTVRGECFIIELERP